MEAAAGIDGFGDNLPEYPTVSQITEAAVSYIMTDAPSSPVAMIHYMSQAEMSRLTDYYVIEIIKTRNHISMMRPPSK